MPEDDVRNDVLAEVAGRLRLPTIATNNVHYALRSDADLSEVLAAIGGRRDLDIADGFRPATDRALPAKPRGDGSGVSPGSPARSSVPLISVKRWRSISTCSPLSSLTSPCRVPSQARMSTSDIS